VERAINELAPKGTAKANINAFRKGMEVYKEEVVKNKRFSGRATLFIRPRFYMFLSTLDSQERQKRGAEIRSPG
jgi:hypothetical protein